MQKIKGFIFIFSKQLEYVSEKRYVPSPIIDEIAFHIMKPEYK